MIKSLAFAKDLYVVDKVAGMDADQVIDLTDEVNSLGYVEPDTLNTAIYSSVYDEVAQYVDLSSPVEGGMSDEEVAETFKALPDQVLTSFNRLYGSRQWLFPNRSLIRSRPQKSIVTRLTDTQMAFDAAPLYFMLIVVK